MGGHAIALAKKASDLATLGPIRLQTFEPTSVLRARNRRLLHLHFLSLKMAAATPVAITQSSSAVATLIIENTLEHGCLGSGARPCACQRVRSPEGGTAHCHVRMGAPVRNKTPNRPLGGTLLQAGRSDASGGWPLPHRAGRLPPTHGSLEGARSAAPGWRPGMFSGWRTRPNSAPTSSGRKLVNIWSSEPSKTPR